MQTRQLATQEAVENRRETRRARKASRRLQRLRERGTPLSARQISRLSSEAELLFQRGAIDLKFRNNLNYLELLALGLARERGYACSIEQWQVVWEWWVGEDGRGMNVERRAYLFEHQDQLPPLINALFEVDGRPATQISRE